MPDWSAIFERGREAFDERFWNPGPGYLYDVVDVDHHTGTVDATFRPNQILAVGGLPLSLVEGDHAALIVNAVEARLLTPLGLRSLSPDTPGYVPHYEGGVWQRDSAYHQGTAWPWLMGPFVEAWVRVRGNTRAAKTEARACLSNRCFGISTSLGWGTSRRSLTAIRRLRRAAAPHRPGAWASCCGWIAWSLPIRRGR